MNSKPLTPDEVQVAAEQFFPLFEIVLNRMPANSTTEDTLKVMETVCAAPFRALLALVAVSSILTAAILHDFKSRARTIQPTFTDDVDYPTRLSEVLLSRKSRFDYHRSTMKYDAANLHPLALADERRYQ